MAKMISRPVTVNLDATLLSELGIAPQQLGKSEEVILIYEVVDEEGKVRFEGTARECEEWAAALDAAAPGTTDKWRLR